MNMSSRWLNIVNLSLSSDQFHPILKESTISPLLKKCTLDKDQISNYCPISILFLLSKIIERVVKSRLTDFLPSNNLLNPHQSAYCKHHSTKTALLYIHEQLSKFDYCNSLYYNLPEYQLNRLQLIKNSPARAVVRTPKSSHITPALRSLQWLKIKERIDYKILYLTNKVLTTTKPSYLYDLISLQPLRSTRSSDVVTLARLSSNFSLKVNNCSFRHASLRLWNELPKELRQLVDDESLSQSSHFSITGSSSSPSSSPLSLCITLSLFHSRLKTYLFHKSFPT